MHLSHAEDACEHAPHGGVVQGGTGEPQGAVGHAAALGPEVEDVAALLDRLRAGRDRERERDRDREGEWETETEIQKERESETMRGAKRDRDGHRVRESKSETETQRARERQDISETCT